MGTNRTVIDGPGVKTGLTFSFTMKRALVIVGSLLIATILLALAWPLPSALSGKGMPENTRISDRHGELLYAVQGSGLRSEIPLENIPKPLLDALIATEDRTFYHHPGLSVRGIARAAVRNVLAGHIVEGGSTITQQLIRTLLSPKRRGFSYKLHEAWLALKYDARFSKHDIVERYLNTSFFGQGAYGVKAAAHVYFDADVSTLSLGQSALLVGLLNAPSALNPFKDAEGARQRRDLVLRAMLDQGKVSQPEFDAALEEPVALRSGKTDIRAPHFVLWLLQRNPELRESKDVVTTLDLALQTETEAIVDKHVEKLKDKNVTSAAVVVLDARTGEILTMVGSRDYFDVENDGAVNVAVSARQPGSAMKPFTYALALSQGMTAATTISDVETQFFTAEGNPYVPRNYDYGYHGLVRIREALANSYNIAAVKVAEIVGVERLLAFLKRAGISTLRESPEHYGLALTLGDGEVKLLELAAAYGIFARGGTTLLPKALLDETGTVEAQILNPKVAWLITDILSDADARAAEFGRDGPLGFPYPVAAKTGTTRNSRDNWTIGYTPDRIVGVWVGNADNAPMRGTSGVTGAGPIFHDVMQEAMKFIEKKPFEKPEGFTDRTICRLSGKLPTPFCTERVIEHFISGTEPHTTDDMFVSISIDTRNGLRAGSSCPEKFIEQKVFTVFPPDTRKWARENGYTPPPDLYSPLCPASAAESSIRPQSVMITRPAENAMYLLDPLIPDVHELIVFEAVADESIEKLSWFVNGTKVGEGTKPDFRIKWKPETGSFIVKAGFESLQSSVHIEVRK